MDFQAIKNQYKSKARLDALAGNLSVTTKSLREKRIAVQSQHDAEMDKARAEAAREAVLSSLVYASRIQRGLLPASAIFSKAFADFSVLWHPRDIVSGDIYWIKNFEEGTILCVCDCTGHGTPGALLTMLVVSAFGVIVNDSTYKDTAGMMRMLDAHLSAALYDSSEEEKSDMADIRDGCDLAILYIANNGDVTFSSANFPIFFCDGISVTHLKGQRIFVGEGKLRGDVEVKTTVIPGKPGNKFYISSDGMFDQKGGEKGLPFGYKEFKNIILQHHNEPQEVIAGKVWNAFESYRGTQPRKDDFELICFRPI